MSCLTVKMERYRPNELAQWMQKTRPTASSQASPSLFALVDGVHLASVEKVHQLTEAMRPWGHGVNLYADLSGTDLVESGPRLYEISDEAIPAWADAACETMGISFLCASAPLPDIAQHLQSIREVMLPDGSLALFRFQDTHVTTHLWPLLRTGQANQILGPAHWWAVPDVCGSWYALTATAGYPRSGTLRFDLKVYEQLNEQLLVYTVAEQVRDVDASLLEPLTSCQCRTLLSARLQAARDLGLQLQSDRALYVVLSLQLPTGFEREAPFAEALDRCRRGFQTFGDALDHVSSEQWRVWDEKLDPV